jgi:hypothetical protein
MKRKSVFAKTRHKFLLKYEDGEGREHKIVAWARVRPAKRAVDLVLEDKHVRKSIKLGGVGSTSSCAVAVCGSNHKDAFPHKVTGLIDISPTRAWVASKLDRFGLPAECVQYDHHHGDIVYLNDTHGGQEKLLAQIERDGPMTISLLPKRVRSKAGRSGKGRVKRGTRDADVLLGKRGGKRRYAFAQLSSEQAKIAAAANGVT